MVIVGVSQAAMIAAGEFIQVSVGGDTIDGFVFRAFGTAANEVQAGLPRPMLLPPGGLLQTSNAAPFEAIICKTLYDAVVILQ